MNKISEGIGMNNKFETLDDMKKFIYNDLGFCGCGSPDKALIFMQNVLKLFKERHDFYVSSCPPLVHSIFIQKNNNEERAKQISKEIRDLLHKDEQPGLYYSYLYFLNSKGFLEHGSGIGGSWTTELCEQFLEALEVYTPKEIFND